MNFYKIGYLTEIYFNQHKLQICYLKVHAHVYFLLNMYVHVSVSSFTYNKKNA